jgi:hypothetical protein
MENALSLVFVAAVFAEETKTAWIGTCTKFVGTFTFRHAKCLICGILD